MKENIFVARADERWTDSLVPFSTTGAETRLLSIKLALTFVYGRHEQCEVCKICHL